MDLNPFTVIAKGVTSIFKFGKHILIFYDSAERCEKKIKEHIDKYEATKAAMEKDIKELTFNYLKRFDRVHESISKVDEKISVVKDELKNELHDTKVEMIVAMSKSNEAMIKKISSNNEDMIERAYSINLKIKRNLYK